MKNFLYSLFVGAAVSLKLQAPETYLVGLSNPSSSSVLFGAGAGGFTQGGEVADAPYYNVVQTFGANPDTSYKLSTSRAAVGAAIVGDLAIFAGGQVNDKNGLYTNVVDLISVSTGSQSTATLSEPRGYLTGASTTTSAYFIGGYTNNNGTRSKVVDQYNVATKKWSTLQLDVGRSNHTSVGVQDYVFIAGGILDIDPPMWTDLIDIIKEDPTTGQATFIDSIEIFGNRSNMASTTLSYGGQSMAFLAGGEGPSCGCEIGWMCTDDFSYCASGLVNILYVDESTGTIGTSWTLLGSIECRSSMSAGAAGNVVLFAGGKNITGYSDMVDIYNVDTSEWDTTQLSVPRSHMAVATGTDGKIYFSGGITDAGVTDVVDVFDTKTMKWVV
jgi:hypothetical protein